MNNKEEVVVDVAAIMREIRNEIIPDKRLLVRSDELRKIDAFIDGSQNDIEEHSNIGMRIPPASKEHIWINRKLVTLSRRLLRKLLFYAFNDQIVVNRNQTACIRYLQERDDVLYSDIQDEIQMLKERISLLEGRGDENV